MRAKFDMLDHGYRMCTGSARVTPPLEGSDTDPMDPSDGV